MTLDHIKNICCKLHVSAPEIFATGRLALPLFGFLLGYKIARTGALFSGGYSRTAHRLAIFGTIATIPFISIGGQGWCCWPFNIMATCLVATLCAWLVEASGPGRLVAAAAVFIVGGTLVEFWWAGFAVCLLAWAYSRRPNWLCLALWISALASLYVINCNLWALAALPLIFAARPVMKNLPNF